jgi:Zn-dependent peptidase ImmA (M78 family)/transcriptional regulator with XRE-family HTH domain
MSRATEVPVTPSVLRWAIEQSGYSNEDLAHAVGVDVAALEEWKSDDGNSRPTLTYARKLASKLHRPFAALLLPAPPEGRPLSVEFRHPAGDQRQLNPNERRYLRRAARLQEILSWLTGQLEIAQPRTPSASLHDDPASVAEAARDLLGVATADQKGWPTASAAFDEWRAALERAGHLVFLFSMGKGSIQGFSLWEDVAPLVAINTAWNESSRIFTLLHEMGHLITRTSSACLESVRTSSRTDPVERWCERFAASVLMPGKDVESTLRQYGLRSGGQLTSLTIAKNVANLYKVSVRAAVIRLIELRAATWALYDEIPPISDMKPPAGGGTGRSRAQIREDQFGDRAASLLAAAVERDVLNRSQAVELLDIPDVAFDDLAQSGRHER